MIEAVCGLAVVTLWLGFLAGYLDDQRRRAERTAERRSLLGGALS